MSNATVRAIRYGRLTHNPSGWEYSAHHVDCGWYESLGYWHNAFTAADHHVRHDCPLRPVRIKRGVGPEEGPTMELPQIEIPPGHESAGEVPALGYEQGPHAGIPGYMAGINLGVVHEITGGHRAWWPWGTGR